MFITCETCYLRPVAVNVPGGRSSSHTNVNTCIPHNHHHRKLPAHCWRMLPSLPPLWFVSKERFVQLTVTSLCKIFFLVLRCAYPFNCLIISSPNIILSTLTDIYACMTLRVCMHVCVFAHKHKWNKMCSLFEIDGHNT